MSDAVPGMYSALQLVADSVNNHPAPTDEFVALLTILLAAVDSMPFEKKCEAVERALNVSQRLHRPRNGRH